MVLVEEVLLVLMQLVFVMVVAVEARRVQLQAWAFPS